MAKGIAVKITKTFQQKTSVVEQLAANVQDIVDNGGAVVSILNRALDVFEILYVTSKREEVEVDVPDELDALDQADGAVN